MKKKDAIRLFGDTATDLARALGISPQAVGKWPDILSERQSREVIGAAVRLGRIKDLESVTRDPAGPPVAA